MHLSQPAVLLVPGGPDALLADRGVVAVPVDIPLDDYPAAAAVVRAAVDRVRADPRVDGDRVALWFFAGAAPLSAEWIRTPPPWLRCVALSDPRLGGAEVAPVFRPIDAVEDVGAAAAYGVAGAMRANGLPIVLVRVAPDAVAEFVAVAGAADANLTVVDDDGSGQAVAAAADAVLATLR